MELYFKLINSHYENVKEIDAATIEEITEELKDVDIIDKLKAQAEAEQKAKQEKDDGGPKPKQEDTPE